MMFNLRMLFTIVFVVILQMSYASNAKRFPPIAVYEDGGNRDFLLPDSNFASMTGSPPITSSPEKFALVDKILIGVTSGVGGLALIGGLIMCIVKQRQSKQEKKRNELKKNMAAY